MRRRGTTNPGSMSNLSRSQPSLACWLLSLCLLLFRPSGSNAEAPPAGQPAKDESVRITAEATYIDHAPRLDGILDDQLWQSAKVITDFRQREPNEGEPATEKTEVRILYTRHAVYFGIHCYDSVPSRIVATELRRDVSQGLDDIGPDTSDHLFFSRQIGIDPVTGQQVPINGGAK